MAYTEENFTNLGTGQSPDPSQATQFNAGVQPFVIDDQTNALLTNITQNAIKKREQEVKQFETKFENTLNTVNKYGDEVDAKDLPEIKKLQTEIKQFAYKNPKALAGMDRAKEEELNKMLYDLHYKANLSKSLKKTEDLYRKDLDKNDTRLNRYLFNQWQAMTPEEKIKNPYVPYNSNEESFLKQLPKLYEKYGEPAFTETVSANDPNTFMVQPILKGNKEKLRAVYKASMGNELTAEYNNITEIKSQYPTVDDYINARADEVIPDQIKSGALQVKTNQLIKNEFTSDEKDKDRALKEKLQGERLEAQRIEKEKQRSDATTKKANALKRYPQYEERKGELDAVFTFTPTEDKATAQKTANRAGLKGELYKVDNFNGGRKTDKLDEHSATDLYINIDDKGNKHYFYIEETADKKQTPLFKSLRDKAGIPTTILKIKNDKQKGMTKEQFEEDYLIQPEKAQRDAYNIYVGGIDEEISNIDKPTVTIPASAEKQLENPKVNQLLKNSYISLKTKYPEIDTNGIAGDKAHQSRDSDHNTMDAIDIVNFGNKSASVITDLQKDGNVKYIIFNKQIWNPKEGWKPYNGTNPHTDHIHVSYVDDAGVKATTTNTKKDWSKYKRK